MSRVPKNWRRQLAREARAEREPTSRKRSSEHPERVVRKRANPVRYDETRTARVLARLDDLEAAIAALRQELER